jgi:hypothetical protein
VLCCRQMRKGSEGLSPGSSDSFTHHPEGGREGGREGQREGGREEGTEGGRENEGN